MITSTLALMTTRSVTVAFNTDILEASTPVSMVVDDLFHEELGAQFDPAISGELDSFSAFYEDGNAVFVHEQDDQHKNSSLHDDFYGFAA